MKQFKIRGSSCSKIMGKRGIGKIGESYLKEWMKEQIYNRKREIRSKYLDKGKVVEDESIEYISKHLGFGMVFKNEERYEDEHMVGTPDVITKDFIIDVKNSWNCFTFPLLDSSPSLDYYWQAQTYMNLCDKDRFKVIYVLSNTPDDLVWQESIRHANKLGKEVDEEIYYEFKNIMSYNDVDANFRIKVYDIDRNQTDIDLIKNRVEESRVIMDKLYKRI